MSNILSSLKSMKRNFSMTLASVVLVSLTLFVIGFIGVIALNTNYLTTNVLKSLSINVYVENSATPEEVAQVGEEIKKIEEVNEVTYSSKDNELKLLSDGLSNNDLVTFFEGEANPLEDLYMVTVDDEDYDMAAVADKIKVIPHVSDVTFGSGNGTDNFIATMMLIQKISLVFAIMLILVSMFIIINTIKLTITARSDEIEIMRLVGATKMYIRLPFMFEGLIIGLLGGMIGSIILLFAYSEMLNASFFVAFKSSLLGVKDVYGPILFGLPLAGMIIGSFSSYLATLKYLNK